MATSVRNNTNVWNVGKVTEDCSRIQQQKLVAEVNRKSKKYKLIAEVMSRS